MLDYAMMPLKRYAEFGGRSSRREYWMFFLAILLLATVLAIVAAILSASSGMSFGAMFLTLYALPGLALLVPNIALHVRRFHDQDRRGWFYLLILIPYLGGLIVLIFMALPGTVGPNRYGDQAPEPQDLA